ncbi:hypothetical protein Dimus_010373 [Dionaea muscipula]
MEGQKRAMSSMAIMVMILIMVAGQSPGTSFQQCYIACYVLCAIQPTNTLSSCAFECLKDCIFFPPSSINNSSFNFCNLGCAAYHCTNISTPQNPGGKAVEGCVHTCSGVCRKSYLAP